MRTSIKEPHHRNKKGIYQHIICLLLLVQPTPCSVDDPWQHLWLGNGILGKADIFNTSVCFTIPLFSFSFPSLTKGETTCITDGEESCLPQAPSHTAIFKQNLLGQAIFFGVTAISVVASLAFPTFLKIQDEETKYQGVENSQLNSDVTSKEYKNEMHLAGIMI